MLGYWTSTFEGDCIIFIAIGSLVSVPIDERVINRRHLYVAIYCCRLRAILYPCRLLSPLDLESSCFATLYL